MAGKDQAADQPSGEASGKSAPLRIARGAFLATRPVQWTKSLLVFLPLAFSLNERWSTPELDLLEDLLRALAGAGIFCALAGAVYIINDVFDRERDRAHPRKRRRPIASGELPLAAAQTVAVILLAASMAGSFLMGTDVGIVSVVFLTMNVGYSSFLKRMIILDVMMVSAGYMLRVVAGAFIVAVPVSPWLYATIGLGALFIALGKRYTELKVAGLSAASQRPVLEQYGQQLLSQLISITSTSCLVAYALYTFLAENVPDNHSMMLTVPFVIFGLFRYLYLVNQTDEAESPELVILRDKPLMMDVLLWAATAIIVLVLDR